MAWREITDLWLERGIQAAVLAALLFAPLALGAVGMLELLWIQGLIGTALLLWLARLWLNPEHRLLWPPICWAVLAFAGYAIWRYLEADIEYVARKESIKVLLYTGLFFVVLNNFNRQEPVQWLAFALVALAAAVAAYALYQFITDSPKVWHFVKPATYKGRATGTYICPNHLAGFLEMILPLALGFALTSRLGHATRIVLGYAALVILAGIGVSISRGGWLATGLALAVLFGALIRNRDYRRPALISLAILLAAGTWFVAKAEDPAKRFRQIFATGRVEDIRFKLWQPAVAMWREDIWLGVGPAHFDFRFRQYRPEDVQMRGDRVHNDYLNTLTDWGILGFGLVLAAWGALAASLAWGWKYIQRGSADFGSRKSNRSAFVLGATTGLVAILAHSVVDFNMHIPANAMIAVTFVALLSAHLRFASERFWVTPGIVTRLALTLPVLAWMGYLAQQGARAAQEYHHLSRAQRVTEYSPEYAARLRQAFAVEPQNFQTAYQIGETLRLQSWQAEEDQAPLAEEAMTWFERSRSLNRYDAYSHLRYGMCLHWLGRHDEAAPHFERARQLDPNGYYTTAHQGWHLVQLGDLAGAKPWFHRSLQLKPIDNPIAHSYLTIVERRLAEATNRPAAPR
jgi:O-antigen ligase/Flp pilus assembly protein TadD